METVITINETNTIHFINLCEVMRKSEIRDLIIDKVFGGREVITNVQYEKLEKLDLRGERITSLDGLEDVKTLKELRLEGASLPELNLAVFPNIEKVFADNCEIERVILCNNDKLNVISLRNNKLNYLNVEEMPNVQFVDISGNRFEGDIDVSSLKKLLCFTLNNNKVSRIDCNEISHFQQLSALNNPIREIHAYKTYCLHRVEVSGGFFRRRGIVSRIADLTEKNQIMQAMVYAS